MSSHSNTSEEPTINPELRRALFDKSVQDKKTGIRALFEFETDRADHFAFEVADIYLDFSKTHVTGELMHLYEKISEDINFDLKRHELFSGVKINSTEDRAVLHALLRDPENQGIATQNPRQLEQAALSQQQFIQQYQDIQSRLAHLDTPIRDIIHVGIGGSSLGTQLVFEALQEVSEATKIHFIGNIDAHKLVSVLQRCDVTSTLVIGVSKTFTTAETLQNIRTIGEWFSDNGTTDFLDKVFAVTASPDNALKFGIPEANTVTFPKWVGGRYSVWSSVSLSAALVLGFDKFSEFLEGAAAIDAHFYHAAPAQNICFIAAMIDHYYVNFFATGSRAIFAYDHRLRSLVDYLQQLETESNGKDRQINGQAVDQKTAPVVWGGVGTDVQHSVFQMLHQGTAIIPSEFLLVVQPDHQLHDHHTELLANGLAQTAALLAGQDLATVYQLHHDEDLPELTAKAKVFSGDRPSTTILLKRLTPRALGSLLAFYEHRAFCNGVFANINSFDQMGVELGKRLAKQVKPILDKSAPEYGRVLETGFDSSTRSLLNKVLKQK